MSFLPRTYRAATVRLTPNVKIQSASSRWKNPVAHHTNDIPSRKIERLNLNPARSREQLVGIVLDLSSAPSIARGGLSAQQPRHPRQANTMMDQTLQPGEVLRTLAPNCIGLDRSPPGRSIWQSTIGQSTTPAQVARCKFFAYTSAPQPIHIVRDQRTICS